MSHYSSSSKYGSSSSYYSRGRESDRGRERDKDWGRDWRRNERDRSREREPERIPRSPPRDSAYFTGRQADRRQQQDKYRSSDDQGSRYPKFSRFGPSHPKRSYQQQSSGYTGTTLIREKDLLPTSRHLTEPLPGFVENHYESFYHTHGQFPQYDAPQATEQRSSYQETDPMDNPLFKTAIDGCISNMKTRGDYDQVRRECLSDIDTKAAFINLRARIKNTVDKYLSMQVFKKDLDKVKTREGMRKKILETPYFEKGIESLVNQTLQPKINSLIRPKIQDEVYDHLKIDKSNTEKDVGSPNQSEPMDVIQMDSVEEETAQSGKTNLVLSKDISFANTIQTFTPSPRETQVGNSFPFLDQSTTGDSNVSEDVSSQNERDADNVQADKSSSRIFNRRSSRHGPHTPDQEDSSQDQDCYTNQTMDFKGNINIIEHVTHSNVSHALPDVIVPVPPILPDTRVPPPLPISSASGTVLTTNILHTCSLPNLSIPPPYLRQSAIPFGHRVHFSMSGCGLQPAPAAYDQVMSLPPLPPTSSIPLPPLPPLPPMKCEVPPPPPSSPPQIPLPPLPPSPGESCSSPPPPPGLSHERLSQLSSFPYQSYLYSSNSLDTEEPLPPGEEPDTYYNELRQNSFRNSRSVEKTYVPSMTSSKAPSPVILTCKKEPTVEEEDVEDVEEEEEVDEDSEEESPMFEKIGEVSPPRVVDLQSSELAQELSKELFRNSRIRIGGYNPEEYGPDGQSLFLQKCRYLESIQVESIESIPPFDYKLSYYKKLPKS